jgi:hypothetical protein
MQHMGHGMVCGICGEAGCRHTAGWRGSLLRCCSGAVQGSLLRCCSRQQPCPQPSSTAPPAAQPTSLPATAQPATRCSPLGAGVQLPRHPLKVVPHCPQEAVHLKGGAQAVDGEADAHRLAGYPRHLRPGRRGGAGEWCERCEGRGGGAQRGSWWEVLGWTLQQQVIAAAASSHHAQWLPTPAFTPTAASQRSSSRPHLSLHEPAEAEGLLHSQPPLAHDGGAGGVPQGAHLRP